MNTDEPVETADFAGTNGLQPASTGNVSPPSPDELSSLLGRNLRRLRTKRGHSMDRLAKLSGVSRAMLGQIETGKSVPSINILWKVAGALNVPFATLIATGETCTTVF